jgi:hypothetical protein
MSSNPYAHTESRRPPTRPTPQQGNFIPGGRGVAPAARLALDLGGWDLFKKQPGMWIGMWLRGDHHDRAPHHPVPRLRSR